MFTACSIGTDIHHLPPPPPPPHTHTQTYTLFPQPWSRRSEMFALLISESLLRFLYGSRYKRCFRFFFFLWHWRGPIAYFLYLLPVLVFTFLNGREFCSAVLTWSFISAESFSISLTVLCIFVIAQSINAPSCVE